MRVPCAARVIAGTVLPLLAACSAKPPAPDAGPQCPPPLFINALDAGPIDGGVLVATYAGGVCGDASGSIGPLGSLQFGGIGGIAIDAEGAIYLADHENSRIWKIVGGQGVVLAGNGTAGFADGSGGSTGTAEFNLPMGLTVDRAGRVYVADLRNGRIRLIDPAGVVTTLAGDGTRAVVDGPALEAQFVAPIGVALASDGTVYVVDEDGNDVREIRSDGTVSTLAGNGTLGFMDGSGGRDGGAEFFGPTAIALDDAGYVYVTDAAIRRVDPITGQVTTFSGVLPPGFPILTRGDVDGPPDVAQFDRPSSLAWGADGLLYVTDSAIRTVDSAGYVRTLVDGNRPPYPCNTDYSDGPAGVASLGLGSIAAMDGGNLLFLDDLCTLREVFLSRH
jgi:hypothetical protein